MFMRKIISCYIGYLNLILMVKRHSINIGNPPSKVILVFKPFNPTNGIVKINMGDSNMPGEFTQPPCLQEPRYYCVYHRQKMTFAKLD